MLTFIAFLFGACIVALTSSLPSIDYYVIAVIILVTVIYFIELIKTKSKYFLPLAIGYGIRLAILIYDIYTNNPLNIPELGSELSSDMLGFYNAAVSFSMGGIANYGGFFSQLFGIVFRLTSDSRLWGEFLIMLMSVANIHVGLRISEELDLSIYYARRFLWCICVLPNYAILSVIFRREVLIGLLLSVSLLFFLKWVKTSSEFGFIISICFALLSSVFHGATGLIIISYIIIHLLYDPTEGRFRISQKNIIYSCLLLFGLTYIFVYHKDLFFNKLSKISGIETLSYVRDAGGSSYAKYVGDSNTLSRVFIFMIPRFIYFMFSPFHWQWRGLGDIIAFLFSSLFYMFLFYKVIRSLFSKNKNRLLISILFIILVFMACVFSWGVTNSGTAMRHRDKFITISCLLFAISFEEKDNNRSES